MELPKYYYNSKPLAALYLLPVLLWFVVSSFITYIIITHGLTDLPWFGWGFLLFFGFGSLVMARLGFTLGKMVFSSLPRLKISNLGVTDYNQKMGEILWSDIEKAYLRATGSSIFICLELRNLDKYQVNIPRFSKWLNRPNRALGFTPITLNLSSIKGDSQEILRTIKTLLE